MLFVFWFRSRGLQVCDYFFAGALAPAVVVVCGKPVLAAALVNLLAGAARPKAEADTGPWCSALRGIDPEVARARFCPIAWAMDRCAWAAAPAGSSARLICFVTCCLLGSENGQVALRRSLHAQPPRRRHRRLQATQSRRPGITPKTVKAAFQPFPRAFLVYTARAVFRCSCLFVGAGGSLILCVCVRVCGCEGGGGAGVRVD